MQNQNKFITSKDKVPLLLFLFISLAITFSWFSTGMQIASGEESFSVFNGRDSISLNGNWEELGAGFANPTNLGRLIPSFIVSILNFFTLPMWLIQASIYFILLATGFVSMYYLTKKILINEKTRIVFFLASFFYFFNLYAMSQVWGRFLYSHIYAWAYMPLFLLTWIILTSKINIKTLLFFVVPSFFFSLAYMQPAFVVTLWMPAFLWTGIKLVERIRSGENYFLEIRNASVGIFAWFLVHVWWLYPYLILSKSTFSEKIRVDNSLDTLISLSQYFPIQQILFLRQSFLFGEGRPWYEFYSQVWVWGLSVIILLLVIIGAFIKRKFNKFFLISLLFVGLFVSKGSNPPLGEIFYSSVFSVVPFLGVLRNSYEKFGLVFLLSYSILFSLGSFWVIDRVFKKNFMVLVFIIAILFTLSAPLLNSVYKKSYVVIPVEYEIANSYINKNGVIQSRILVMPIIPGDSAEYTWGYQGVEPSEYLFDHTSISKMLRQPYFDDKYNELYMSYVEGKSIQKYLEDLNIQYIVLHNDLVEKKLNASSSADTEKYLAKQSYLKKRNSNKLLSIYENTSFEKNQLFGVEGEKKPKISYRKVNQRHYKVSILQADNPYILLFKYTYHPLWTARINGQEIKEHEIIYGYANSWKISKTGNYEIDIEFSVWPWE